MKKLWILRILHSILLIGPVVYFAATAFIAGEIHQKLTLGLSVMLVGLLTLLGIIRKHKLMSPLYFMIIAINLIFDNLIFLFCIMAITTFLDEMVISPLLHKEKRKIEILKVTGKI